MLRSMTGFGAATCEGGALRASVEARSVNHRHLQVKTRLPSELSSLEAELEALVRSRLARGAVGIGVSAEGRAGSEAPPVDLELARRYAEAARSLARDLGLAEGLSAGHLLALPGVAGGARIPPVGEQERAAVLEAAGRALEQLVRMREAEGRALAADLRVHLAALDGLLARIGKRMPGVVRRQQQALRKRVAELIGKGSALAPADLAREVALIADRSDVSEELARLVSHLDQMEKELSAREASGRKLDFLVQEVLREVNTLGAKCSDAQVTVWVVEAKTRIERLREQVQNIE